ncbi:MAG: hypothetical protein ACI8RZ_005515 [Myxococcota bacterium]|jgi:hypothetical protein
MIINNLSDASVSDAKLITFNERDIKYVIDSTQGQLTGEVKSNTYRDVSVASLGNGPFKVTLGYVNDSYRAAPVEVDNSSAMLSFWMAFPAGPNGPKTLVYSKG